MSGEHAGTCFSLLIFGTNSSRCVSPDFAKQPRVVLPACSLSGALGIDTSSLLTQKPRTSAPASSLPTLGIQSAFTIQVKECKSPHHSLVREMGRKREPTTTPFPRRKCFCSELHGSNSGCFSGKATVDSTWKGGCYYESREGC